MKWISVKDRLPENDDDVLTFSWNQGVQIGNFNRENVRGYYEPDGKYTCIDDGWEIHVEWSPTWEVTHWMPLPDPPEN